MKIRMGTEEDIDAITENAAYAYGMSSDAMDGIRETMRQTEEFLEYYIADVDGEVAAQVRLIPFEQNIRGTIKRMGGVSMVASEPRHRRQGYVRQLMLKITEDLREENYAVTTLYPFKDSFYGALGYVKMPPLFWMEINPRQLENWNLPDGYNVKRMQVEDGLDEWREIHDAVVPKIHGGVRRSDQRWEETKLRTKHDLAIAYGPDGSPGGYMTYRNKGYGRFGDSDKVGTMSIREIIWKNNDARAVLLHFIRLHMDQIIKAKIPVTSQSTDYYHYAKNLNVPIMKARLIAMASIVDVRFAVGGLPITIDGEVTLRIKDRHHDWNNQAFKISGEKNLSAEPLGNESTQTTLTVEGLTSLIYGSLSVDQLNGLGMLTGEEPTLLDEWFPRCNPWLSEDF